jgi:hypothetical protein
MFKLHMIGTIGFESEILSSVTENIDKFIEDMAKQHGQHIQTN